MDTTKVTDLQMHEAKILKIIIVYSTTLHIVATSI